MKQIAEQISVEGGELVMSVAEKLRQEGIEDGMFKKAKKMAKKMIINGESLEKIISYTELSAEEIKQIREEMLR